MNNKLITGECFCGSIKYQIEGKLRDATSCHCSRCRKAFNAQASAAALVYPSEFTWLEGEDLLTSYVGIHNFGLQLNIPILNGFSARNNVERSKVNAEKAKVAFNQAETDLEKNVYTAFTNATGALKTYESALSTLEARQEAFNYAKIAKESSPDNPGIMDTMRLAYYNKELYGNAVNEFLDSLQKLPENAEIHYHLGMAYDKKGEPEKAIKQLETALELSDTFEGNEEAVKLLAEIKNR